MPLTALQGACLGFDYGAKRIGIASGNTLTGTAMPIGYIRNDSGTPDWESIDNFVEQWKPVALVVGEPLTADGSEQESTRQARGFYKRLSRRFEVPTFLVDERYSSIEASELLREGRALGARRQTQKSDIDRIAATIILQRWLDQQNSDEHKQ